MRGLARQIVDLMLREITQLCARHPLPPQPAAAEQAKVCRPARQLASR
jgi:hypothetical protein